MDMPFPSTLAPTISAPRAHCSATSIVNSRLATRLECKVAWTRNTGSREKIHVGVQLLSKPECPWIMFIPRSERQDPTAAPGLRRWARHKVAFPITLNHEQTPVRV